jgi:hypothetical protein
VTYRRHSLPGQVWGFLVVVAIGAALAAPAFAQGPDPAPGRGNAPRPDPVPSARAETPATPRQAPRATTPARVVAPPAAPAPPATIIQPSFSPPVQQTPLRRPRTQAPKKPKPAVTKPRREPASRTMRAAPIAKAVSTSPDGTLLAGGLALFALILGETLFLTLSVRFLRIT